MKWLLASHYVAVLKTDLVKKQIFFLTSLTFILVQFQNCSGGSGFKTNADDTGLPSSSSSGQQISNSVCQFDGKEFSEGASTTAFLNSSVAASERCMSETRTCLNGSMTGTYSYSSCSVNEPRACLFNAMTTNSGSSVTAYLSSAVDFGGTCVSEARTCNDGVLSGSYQYSTCSVGTPKSCLFNGATIAHSTSVKTFLQSTVAFGSSCVAQDRVCTNGTLSGTYAYASCSVDAPKTCLFDGKNVASGESVFAFQNSTVPFGQTCNRESRQCINGTLSGSYSFSNCNVGAAASCRFNGATVVHGESTMAYATSTVGVGQTCRGENRICNNGSLSGTYTFSSCSVDAPQSCLFNGQQIASGQGVDAFQNSSVAFGVSCTKETRLCTNGMLSGSYSFASCSVDTPKSCLFNSQQIAHGQSVNAFQNSTVAFGSQCMNQARVCNNGNLSGSYSYSSCEVGAPASCQFNGQQVGHSANVVAYQASTVPFGQTCVSENRSCSNGALSGSYVFASCSVGAAASCMFNGQQVAHGQSVSSYLQSSVPFGQSCSMQNRLCNNGSLSGSYSFASCAVDTPKSCLFNGQQVAHGEIKVAYATASVAAGQVCNQQNRTCNDGVLSGTFSFSSCVVERDVDPNTLNFTSVKMGQKTMCGMTTDKDIYCWGVSLSNSSFSHIRPVKMDFKGKSVIYYDVQNAYGSQLCAIYSDNSLECFNNAFAYSTARPTAADLQNFKSVKGGTFNSCGIKIDGSLKCWGSNSTGDLGVGNTNYIDTFVTPTGMESGVLDVSVGFGSYCAIKDSVGDLGRVYCWGSANNGPLGDGVSSSTKLTVPTKTLISNAKKVEIGAKNICALLNTGKVVCWGSNFLAANGQPISNQSALVQEVPNVTNAVDLVSRKSQIEFCALLQDKSMKCWGMTEENAQRVYTSTHYNYSTPNSVPNMPANLVSIAAGEWSVCAVDTNGKIHCKGNNSYSTLGTGRTLFAKPTDLGFANVSEVKVARANVCVQSTDGTSKCIGDNWFLQLGNTNLVQTSYSEFQSTSVAGVKSLYASANSEFESMCALDNAGVLKCWGYNGYGETGLNTFGGNPKLLASEIATVTEISSAGSKVTKKVDLYTDRPTVVSFPKSIVKVVKDHNITCAQDTDLNWSCWGSAGNQEIVSQFTSGNIINPQLVKITGAVTRDLVVGYQSICSINTNDTVSCWGRLQNYYLSTSLVDMTAPYNLDLGGQKIKSLSLSSSFGCGLSVEGKVTCFGYSSGLAKGNTSPFGNDQVTVSLPFPAVQVGVGDNHTCALLNQGDVYCWGTNDKNQLGVTLQPLVNKTGVPQLVPGLKAKSISIGSRKSCAIDQNNKAICWGEIYFGENKANILNWN